MKAIVFDNNKTVTDELDEFSEKLKGFQDRSYDPDEFKHRRLLQGIYGQRQPARFMVRVKIPAGGLNKKMIEGLVSVVGKYSSDQLHITTRQDFQLYDIKIGNLEPMLRELAAYGITTREASGATIRNIITSPFAGLARDQVFDITDVVEKTVRFFLRHPETQHLPRKFKVAFSENDSDLAATGMHDLGYIATLKDGKPGFKVVIGGSLGSIPLKAQVYQEFIPVEDSLLHLLAVLRAFNKHGDRSKRSEARLKFQLEKIGFEKFLGFVAEELNGLKEENYPFPEITGAIKIPDEFDYSNPFDRENQKQLYQWFQKNVIPTIYKDTYMISVRVPSGDIDTATFTALSEKLQGWQKDFKGEEFITLADNQNLVLKGVVVSSDQKAGVFSEIYNQLSELGLGGIGIDTVSNVIACKGSATCASGITNSPGMGKVVGEFLEKYNSLPEFEGTKVYISGCANSCARHHLATLGFSGRADTNFDGDNHVPMYNVFFGGAILSSGKIRIGKKARKMVFARRVPAFIEAVVADYRENGGEVSFDQYVSGMDPAKMEDLIDLFSPEKLEVKKEEYILYDWSEDEPYVMEYGEGECS